MSISKSPLILVVFSAFTLALAFQNCAQSPNIAEEDLDQGSTGVPTDPGQVVLDPIEINSFSPMSGPISGGTVLSIYGMNFKNTDVVKIGGVVCPSTVLVNSSELNCAVPATAAAKIVAVSVTRMDATSAATKNGYEYSANPTNHVACSASSTSKVLVNRVISFPSSLNGAGCVYSSAYPPKSGYAQARKEYLSSVQVPANVVVCNAALEIKDTDFLVRNHFILSLNNRVLAASSSATVGRMDRDAASNLFIYSWAKAAGVAFNLNSYCLRAGTTNGPICQFSNPTVNHFNIHYKPLESDLKPALSLRAASGQHFVRLTVIGDAQANDCTADALSGTMAVTYDIP